MEIRDKYTNNNIKIWDIIKGICKIGIITIEIMWIIIIIIITIKIFIIIIVKNIVIIWMRTIINITLILEWIIIEHI